jgi:predicted phosphodiesterase
VKIALLSDIHGNLVALDAVLADLAAHGPFDQMVVAGDLAWSGPWPAEVVDRVRAMDAAVIQGNTDAFFGFKTGDVPDGKSPERFAAQLAWMKAELGPERTAYLASLPFDHCISPARGRGTGDDLYVVHANPRDLDQPITPLLPEAELDGLLLNSFSRRPWSALAFGHVHVPFQRQWRGRLLVNVASVGLPMDGDPRAAWAILTWDGLFWRAEHRRVFYKTQIVAHRMRSCGMPRGKHFAERLMGASYNRGVQPAVEFMAAD